MLDLFLAVPLSLWILVFLPIFCARVWRRHEELSGNGDYQPLGGGGRLRFIIFNDWTAMLVLLTIILAFLSHAGKVFEQYQYYWF